LAARGRGRRPPPRTAALTLSRRLVVHRAVVVHRPGPAGSAPVCRRAMIGRDPIPAGGVPMVGGKTFRNAVHAVAAVALAATAAACGLGSADTGAGPSSPPDAPVVDVAATEQIDLGAYLDLGVTETGLYTVTEDAVVGFDRAGARRWTLRAEGSRPDPDRVEAVPFAPVLLVGWDDAAGLVAYSTDSGEELWRTEDEEWAQGDIADGRVSFADAVTGERRWSVELTSFGCPHADDPLTPVWLREVVLVRCFKNPAPG